MVVKSDLGGCEVRAVYES